MAKILVGTASWADNALVQSGLFYPPGMTDATEILKFYAERFPVVEVDSSYYAMPSERNSKLWAERSPDGFVFDVKAFALLTTHCTDATRLPKAIKELLPGRTAEKQRIYPREVPEKAMDLAWQMFDGALRPLHDSGKLGAVFFQFPKWFPLDRKNKAYIEECRKRLPDYRIAVEFRQSSWMSERNVEETANFLEGNGLAYTAVDEPQGFESSVQPVNPVTSDDLAVVRFHGRNSATWESVGLTSAERFNYLYNDSELEEWVPRIRQMADQVREVHVLFNNNYSNYAQKNALRMKSLLGTRE
jgi:uncharacterized protein YecE (DUF72 family)